MLEVVKPFGPAPTYSMGPVLGRPFRLVKFRRIVTLLQLVSRIRCLGRGRAETFNYPTLP